MARVFVTGSSTGLGLMAGELLVEQGHRVVLHARNQARAEDARRALPEAEAVVLGDLSTVAGARSVADAANRLGRFDAIIHNVGVGYRDAPPTKTEGGLPLPKGKRKRDLLRPGADRWATSFSLSGRPICSLADARRCGQTTGSPQLFVV